MYKCKVCGKEFELQKENHYVSISRTPTGLAALISSETAMYDAFDCTHCGCQNRVSERYVNYANTMAGMAVDEEENEEEHECFGDYCGEYKCDDCGSETRCLKETVLEAQNTLKKYRNEKNMEVVKEGLKPVPECFGTYEKNALACGGCEFMVECNSKDCENEKEKSEECFDVACERAGEGEGAEKPECFSYYENESKCNKCEFKEECVSESWEVDEEEQEGTSGKHKRPSKHKKPSCFGKHCFKNCDCDWDKECFEVTNNKAIMDNKSL